MGLKNLICSKRFISNILANEKAADHTDETKIFLFDLISRIKFLIFFNFFILFLLFDKSKVYVIYQKRLVSLVLGVN